MMSISFTHYSKVKNHYCLAYYGMLPEYIVQLRMIRPLLQSRYPQLKIFISCNDDLAYLLGDEIDVFPYSMMQTHKCNFAHIREILINLQPPHSIFQLVQDSLPDLVVPRKADDNHPRYCLICPDAGSPTNCLSKISRVKSYAEAQGYKCIIVGSDLHYGSREVDIRPSGHEKMDIIRKAGWVVGAENEYLFEAARLGLRTTLVPSGLGTELYKVLVPCGELFPL